MLCIHSILGWNVYTTLDTEMQNHAEDAIFKNIEVYSERYGWIEKNNFAEELGDQFFEQIILNGPSIIFDAVDEASSTASKIIDGPLRIICSKN